MLGRVWLFAGLCPFGDNPRTKNQHVFAMVATFGAAGVAVTVGGKLRLSFNGHKSSSFPSEFATLNSVSTVGTMTLFAFQHCCTCY